MSNSARRRLLCLGAVLMGGLVYGNALNNPFVYDDYVSVVENPSIHPPLYLRSVLLYRATRPLVNASYAIDGALWGPQPFGFHLSSVVLHMLNVALLFLLAWRLTEDWQKKSGAAARPQVAATAAALLLAVHPLMTEAVGYISGRSELLCAMFFMIGMLSARHWMRDGGARWWMLTFVSWILALASKESAVMFPLVLFGYDRLVLDTGSDAAGRRRRLLGLHLPMLTVAAAGGALRFAVFLFVEHQGGAAIHWQYGLVELDVFRRYLMLLVYPTGQSIFHQVAPIDGLLDLRAWLAIGVMAILVGGAWYMRRLNGMATFGAYWFLLLLVPPAVLVMFDRGEPMAEHRVYVAACGLFLTGGALVAWFLARVADSGARAQMLARAGLAVALVALCGHTLVRNHIWGDPVALWTEAVNGAPRHWRAWLLLGEAFHHAGRGEEAIGAYTNALTLRPAELGGYERLARYQAELGHLDDASSTFERLQRLDPESNVASNGLGNVAMMAGHTDEARTHFLKSLERYPADIPARQSLALLEETLGDNPEAALRHCEEIRRLAPATPGNDDCINRNKSKVAAHVSRSH